MLKQLLFQKEILPSYKICRGNASRYPTPGYKICRNSSSRYPTPHVIKSVAATQVVTLLQVINSVGMKLVVTPNIILAERVQVIN